jgi:streptomycin 6-kinase
MSNDATLRLEQLAQQWRVMVDRVVDTPYSLLGHGKRDSERVVLKIVRSPGDEWTSGAITAAYHGRGMVRVLEHEPGAALLEELSPARELTQLVTAGNDSEAMVVIATVIREMQSTAPQLEGLPTAEDWGAAFHRYRASGDAQIPNGMIEDAHARYNRLCETQAETLMLHGDLQHTNVVWDERRGWTAIDPKGVLAELEYELVPALRNPAETPQHYSSAAAVGTRIRELANELPIDEGRLTEWAYAQAVLSAIWTIEDDGRITPTEPSLLLARAAADLLGVT